MQNPSERAIVITGTTSNSIILINSNQNRSRLNIIHQFQQPSDAFSLDDYNKLKNEYELSIAKAKTLEAKLKQTESELFFLNTSIHLRTKAV